LFAEHYSDEFNLHPAFLLHSDEFNDWQYDFKSANYLLDNLCFPNHPALPLIQLHAFVDFG